MLLFLFGIVLLCLGYRYYGRFIERILAPDDRQTPAVAKHDGVDFVVLPHWKNMLIQLLNIAGVGPVIGVILGIKFGSIAFLIIPVGNVLAGATHDFIGGMMSIRHEGANLPKLIEMNLGRGYAKAFSVFMVFLLLLVVAVFINIPAKLINFMLPGNFWFWIAVGVIFIYYICATLFPVDKIIGRIYPLFGAMLLFGTLALGVALLWAANTNWDLLTETAAFRAKMNSAPVVPVLFVTIACGIISGFHATQSPIIARTMISERQGREAFYGMMIVEGIIAMIWAGAAMAIYNLMPETMDMDAAIVLGKITDHFLVEWSSFITVIGVILLAITSGDTAMRSLRLSLAEMFNMDQKPFRNRILICVPLIAVVAGLLFWSNLSAESFAQLWNYFAWGNQVLAASTLMAAGVWLFRQRKNGWVALLPGMFMVFIVVSYIVWVSKKVGGPVGFGLPLSVSYGIAGAAALAFAAFVWLKSRAR